MTNLSRTPLNQTGRRGGRVGGSLLRALPLPYELPIGIGAWILGSAIAMVALMSAVVALASIVEAMTIVSAVTVPATALYVLSIVFFGTAMIVMAQHAWLWSLPVQTRMAPVSAQRVSRVGRTNWAPSNRVETVNGLETSVLPGLRAVPSQPR